MWTDVAVFAYILCFFSSFLCSLFIVLERLFIFLSTVSYFRSGFLRGPGHEGIIFEKMDFLYTFGCEKKHGGMYFGLKLILTFCVNRLLH